jgi:hypothetical protein
MQETTVQAAEIEKLFTRASGDYAFARWGRPIAPVVFGLEAETLPIIKGAIEAVVALAGHKMAQTDPELGANLLLFFFREWRELLDVPGLEQMVEGLPARVAQLEAQQANQYRGFRFDAAGAVKACFSFVRVDAALEAVPAETLALSQAVHAILPWSAQAFEAAQPLAQGQGGAAVLRADIAAVIRAAYDPVMPDVAQDASHAIRLAARVGLA